MLVPLLELKLWSSRRDHSICHARIMLYTNFGSQRISLKNLLFFSPRCPQILDFRTSAGEKAQMSRNRLGKLYENFSFSYILSDFNFLLPMTFIGPRSSRSYQNVNKTKRKVASFFENLKIFDWKSFERKCSHFWGVPETWNVFGTRSFSRLEKRTFLGILTLAAQIHIRVDRNDRNDD